MKRIYFSILASLIVCFALPAKAQQAFTIDKIPNVRTQSLSKYVSDPTQIVDAATKNQLDQKLQALEKKTGAEVAVVTVPSIGEADCFEFAVELFNKWGIGKSKKDNGLLVLLVIDQGCIQFNTGYGLEGILPDITCKRIQTQNMIPYFKSQNWSAGLNSGIDAVYEILYNNMEDGEVINTPNEPDYTSLLFVILAIFGCIILIILLTIFKIAQQNKCPSCKRKTLTRVNSKVIEDTPDYRIIENEFVCSNCGHRLFRKERQAKMNNRSRGGGGPVIFGPGGGGSRRGGSFGGGSFGGGRTGGGGAGSRF